MALRGLYFFLIISSVNDIHIDKTQREFINVHFTKVSVWLSMFTGEDLTSDFRINDVSGSS